MKIKKLLLVLSLVFIQASSTWGEPSYVFHYLSTKNGLSNNAVRTILKDSYGFLWVGTEFGLNRYDGYNFKVYFSNAEVSNTLPSSNINGLQEDGLKNIWIDFGSNNYAVYNREKDNFNRDLRGFLQDLHISYAYGDKIYVDKKKNLVVSNRTDVYIYSCGEKTTRHFKINKLFRRGSGIEISDDYENLYFVSTLGECWKLNKKSGLQETILLPGAKQLYRDNRIFVDSRGGIWIYSFKYEQILYRKENTHEWKTIFLNSQIKSQSNIFSVIEDSEGKIYIGTDHKGIFVFNKSDETLTNILSSNSNPASLLSNNVGCLFYENNGTLWVGHSKNGISVFNENFQNFITYHQEQCKDVSKIVELQNGNILLGTDGDGLFVQNRDTKKIAKLPVPNTAIVSMIEDRKGRIWIGTYQKGLFCMDHSKFYQFTTSNSNLSSNNIWGLREDRYGNIWIGTLGSRIYKFASGDDINKSFFHSPFDTTIYASDIECDGGNKIYVGSINGLVAIDVKTDARQVFTGNKKGTQRFKNQQLSTVFKDSRNLLWIGSVSGLTIWDTKKDTLYYYDMLNGLCDNIIKDIKEDNSHNIWVSTSNGLSVLNVRQDADKSYTFENRNFSDKDGLKSNYFNSHSICKLRNGDLLIGSIEGVIYIDPNKLEEKKMPLPQVIFTKMQVGNTPVLVDSALNGDLILRKSIELSSQLDLKYNHKHIKLEFSTLDLINADKVKYQYKIEGFNDQWISTTKNEIYLTSLPVGKYKLLVKACNSDGVWSAEPKVLVLNVAPPFYLSFWAIIVYILLSFDLILYAIYRNQKRHKYKLEQHTIQMAQEQEMKVTEMKLRFFTNISHDLRTPLTLIITPLQSMLRDVKDESLKKKLDVMFKNAQQLLSLINSLLDFRKLDVGAEHLNLKPGDIVGLVDEIYSSFNVYAIDRNITFLKNSSVDKLWIEYDQDKIMKCIVNVLSNAFKYTPNGGTIVLTLFTDNTDVCISVSDTGIGIADEDKKFVFDRFYQTTQNTKTTGSGIGLHIVSEYMKLHDGTIVIEDNVPSGCIFTIRFPIIQTIDFEKYEDAEFHEEIDVVGNRPVEIVLPKQVLLFVDDNQDLCDFISDNLCDDYTVLIANNGQEALLLLNNNDVNIVVSDIMMPVMDGIELCRQIKTNINWSHVPVILLTARTADEHKIEGLELGADDYLTKPFNLDILKLRITKFIEWNLNSHLEFKDRMDISPSEITITALDEKLIEKAIKIVEEHMKNTEFSVEMLGEGLSLSRGHLYKKLMAITGKGPAEFIRTIRLKRGRQLLEKSQMQIAEIAYEVGYNSPKRFTINFKEEFGVSPSEYVRTYKLRELG
ncbi:MAG TPA: two-component regulator propeller domain-containing protein [Paludibacter sp.]|nr:two-component regulator propeller domain-containing protein [Paludibacter sp.]